MAVRPPTSHALSAKGRMLGSVAAFQDPRLASSMTLPLGDGVVSATRWRDGTVSLVADRVAITEPTAEVARKLAELARFVAGGVEVSG